MTRKFNAVTATLATTGLVGLTLLSMPKPAAAAYKYSALFTMPFGIQCRSKVKNATGSTNKAKQVCACLLNNLQGSMSQGTAINKLRAMNNGPTNGFGLPTGLNPYLKGC